MKKYIAIILTVFVLIIIFSGCDRTHKIANITDYLTSIAEIKVSENVKIVGLGEATHGNSELQTLKLDVFKSLIENNDCRIFAIEGDFGGCAKVNEYIMGGKGTAREAAAEIGFAIYRTQEIEDLIQWMREYNDIAPEPQKLKFYGYDMQRYDNNKELLFEYLDKTDKQLSKEYRELLSDLNDETVFNQDKSKIKKALAKTEELMEKIIIYKDEFIEETCNKEFEFALQCIQSIKENATLRGTSVNYSNTRDEYMKKKVDWILNFEDNQLIFITGHNGHIEKTSASVGFTCMGQRLDDSYGEVYYAIGTDFIESNFNVVTSSGDNQVITIKHNSVLKSEFKKLQNNIEFMDFHKAKENKQLEEILNSQISMVNIGAKFNSWQKVLSKFYTLKITPSHAYDGIIVIKKASPSNKRY